MARGDDADETHLQLTEDQLDHLLRLNDYFNVIQQNDDIGLDEHNLGNLLRLNDAVMNLRSRYPHLGQIQQGPQVDEDRNGTERRSGVDEITSDGSNLISRGVIMPGERVEPHRIGIYENVEYSLSDNQREAQDSGSNVSDDDNQSKA